MVQFLIIRIVTRKANKSNKTSLHRLYAKDFNKSEKTFTNLPNIYISGQNYKQIKDKQTKDKDLVLQF